MTVLQFIASLVQSLAWPAAVVGLALTFRKPLLTLLERVGEMEFAGMRFAVARKVEKLAAETAQLTGEAEANKPEPPEATKTASEDPEPSPPPNEPGRRDRAEKRTKRGRIGPILDMRHVLPKSPAELILDGWAEIEAAVFEAAREAGLPPGVGGLTTAHGLHHIGVLSDRTVGLIQQAAKIRNRAALGELGNFSVADAHIYLGTARAIVAAVKREAAAAKARAEKSN